MRILYTGLRWDFDDPARGESFEHWNMFDPLRRMGHDIIYWDFGSIRRALGHEAMNAQLEEVARVEKPDLLFCFLFMDELDRSTIRRISDHIPTVNWFADDHWRFESFSRKWAPSFTHVVTTANSALPKYAAIGYPNVIKSQWACNPWLYRPLDLEPIYDVSFVGRPHGVRREIAARLADAGIKADFWGLGWGHGRISQDEMIRVFNQSRINLNLSQAPAVAPEPELPRILSHGLVPWRVQQRLKKLLNPGAASWSQFSDQIKGRNFELPGCAAFQLSGQAENLATYLTPGREIALYDSTDDLIDKIRHYLKHEDERAAIARGGYERTMREHTWVHRFTEVLLRMGFTVPPAEAILSHPPQPGSVLEIAPREAAAVAL